MLRTLFLLALTVAAGTAIAQSRSPYAGQQTREIKALSDQEISDYLAGKGMGLAKAAELNGYPGPAHVLESAQALHLSAEQEARTRDLFNRMQKESIALGKELVDKERQLDQAFASKTVTPESLSASLSAIGELQAKIRQTHLVTHLAESEILNPDQVALYNELRGYGASRSPHAHHLDKHPSD